MERAPQHAPGDGPRRVRDVPEGRRLEAAQRGQVGPAVRSARSPQESTAVVAGGSPDLPGRGLLRMCMHPLGIILLFDVRKMRLLGFRAGMGGGADCLARGGSRHGRQAAQGSLSQGLLLVPCWHTSCRRL